MSPKTFRARLRRIIRDAFLDAFGAAICAAPCKAAALPQGCIIAANHTSHLDSLVILAALSPEERDRTRPVAAADYWTKTPLRRYVSGQILNAVLIDRKSGGFDALMPAEAALSQGQSLIIFPEGTRSPEAEPGPFKGGFAELAIRAGKPVVPAYLANLNRIMPKGAPLPLPLTCQARFGAPIDPAADGPGARKALCSKTRDAVRSLYFDASRP